MTDLTEDQVAQLSGTDVRFIRRAIKSGVLPDLHPDTVRPWLHGIWVKHFRRSVAGDMRVDGWTPPTKHRGRGSKW
jgi:hypothetical protein